MSETDPRPYGGVMETIMGPRRSRDEETTRRNNIPNRRAHSPAWTTRFDPGPQTTVTDFDEYGAELGPEARVWKTYTKEADNFDLEQVEGWNRSLDVTIVFATFFAAICTAFVIESAKSLKEDANEMSARRLDHITGILLVVANVTNPSGLNTTQILNPDPFSPRAVDVCINALWTFSLITSVTVPPIAMLAKEWCYLFMSSRTGDLWLQMTKRQKRWGGVEKWRMEKVILFLPSLIHLAFLTFAVGLCLYVGDLYPSVAIPAAAVTLGAILVYVASTLLPLWDDVCPYRSPISTLMEELNVLSTPSEYDNKDNTRVSVQGLAWLIKTSKNQESVEIALQAIAGADHSDEDRLILKDCGADKMILRRLIALDPYSSNYDQILDLYTRAQSFFHPGLPAVVVQKEAPIIPSEEEVSSPTGEPARRFTGVLQKNANRELQRKLRKLRDTIDQEITAYATSSPAFRPTFHSIAALRIGSTAASYCLQSLQNGAQVQTAEQFDAVVDLLTYHQADLQVNEIQSLMTGTAMLLSSLLVDCPPTIGAQYVVRLLRMADRAGDASGQRQLALKWLRLPMVVYALSQNDYPGWIHPPPLAPISRAERAIEIVSYYVSNRDKLVDVTPTMVNLGLLQLLSDSEECNLEPADIVAISEAFMDDVEAGQALIYTFAANPYPSIYSRTLKSIVTIAPNGSSMPSKDTVAIACLNVLNRAPMVGPIADAPIGQVYAFMIECVLDLPLATPEAYGVGAALDVMQKLRLANYPGWTPELILDLASSLAKREIVTKLKEATELDATVNYQDFEMKLFATGQAHFLLNLALQSETAADQEVWRCLSPFIEDERLWDSPEDVRRNLREQATILGERYRRMWESDDTPRHSYYQTLLQLAETCEGSSQPANS